MPLSNLWVKLWAGQKAPPGHYVDEDGWICFPNFDHHYLEVTLRYYYSHNAALAAGGSSVIRGCRIPIQFFVESL